MKSRFNSFYRSIIKQDSDIRNEGRNKENKSQQKEDTPINLINQKKDTPENDNGVKSLEKDFLNKFIRYNELQLLMRDLPEIANSFKSIQGFDEQLIKDTVEKLLSDRQKEIDSLTKDLTDLREKITKEAQVANYKKSVIDIFNNQSTTKNNDSPYGYTEKQYGDAFNNGETIAAQDGVPTVSVGMPEPIDAQPNELMKSEELPDKNENKTNVIDDLTQALEKDADTVEIPEIPQQKGKLSRPRLKSLEKTNLSKTPILIDSKKSKSKKSKK